MAEIKIILQGLNENDDHETAVNNLLSEQGIDNFLFSLAFVRKSGVEIIKDNLEKVSDKANVFIGIRNGVTSVQGIFSLLEIGIYPFVIDTASNGKIFHPKIYSANNENRAHIVVGSANLTFGGLNGNIEASSVITLDRRQQTDEEYFKKLEDTIINLPTKFPDHVFQVRTPKEAVALLQEGRLEDERLTKLPSTKKVREGRERDSLSPMPTFERRKPKSKSGIKKRTVKAAKFTGILVWESKPLTERSLNIPQGEGTNITGDTNLGIGSMSDINFQHYFRDTVFSELGWRTTPKSPHLERATINVEIVIKNLSYGIFHLEVTHDPRTNTKSYQQKNAMTKIKWGDARSIIAKRDLLGRTMQLYKKSSNNFVIVID